MFTQHSVALPLPQLVMFDWLANHEIKITEIKI